MQRLKIAVVGQLSSNANEAPINQLLVYWINDKIIPNCPVYKTTAKRVETLLMTFDVTPIMLPGKLDLNDFQYQMIKNVNY